MIARLLRQHHPVVCLDFGRDRLSALEVTDGVVTRWISRPLAGHALKNGDPVQPGVLGEAVRQLLVQGQIQARHARMAVPDEATVSRHLQLPAMPRRDLVRAMHFEAEKHIPFPTTRARWSWDVVERARDHISVYLVATWRDVVDRFAEVARTAGLVPQVLEPRAVAVARALDQEHALLVDAGARRLQVTLLMGGLPAFADEVVTGEGVDRREGIDRLLQRAYRHQSTAGATAGRLAPILVAGEVELSEVELPVGGRPVEEVLNGMLPILPNGFRAGRYLAALGLSMRELR